MPDKKRKRVKRRSEELSKVNELIREIEKLEEKLSATESHLAKQIVQLEEHVSYLENLIKLPRPFKLEPIGPIGPLAPEPVWQKQIEEIIRKQGYCIGDPPPGTSQIICENVNIDGMDGNIVS